VALVELSRRDFLKVTGAGAAGAAAAVALSTIPDGSVSAVHFPLDERGEETPTICCYCSVGCGALVIQWIDEDGGVHRKIEGDPDHPINRGSLCPKGQAMYQIHEVDGEINDQRVTKPLYRAPGSSEWEEKDWDWMLDTIARRVKDTREARLVETDGGKTVNRNEGMGSFGGGELDNEECYLLAKMSRALGVVYLEHCARL
jgi:anaerobic selenocysteine-containing dehydrogenase